VAYRWRFRHKLFLAHGLVVAIVVLLSSATLYGLISYRTTTRTCNKKLLELTSAEEFRNKVKAIEDAAHPNDKNAMNRHIEEARQTLDKYLKQLQEFTHPGQDYAYGGAELAYAQGLQKTLVDLENAVGTVVPQVTAEPAPLIKAANVQPQFDKLRDGADDLIAMIRTDLQDRLDTAGDDYKLSLWFMIGISSSGFILMTGSLRFFYRWIFYPIRDLQQGVSKVAKGDFKHVIKIQSSDEIQDLAAAFNDMTHRLDEMYADLARQVNERSRQLVRSERLASVGFLAAGVAHEINNPLASIVFCSEALERRILDMLAQIPASSTAAEESKVITKYLKMIQQESLRCKEITARLLEFSRGGERRREPTDLGELVQGVLDMVQHLQNRRGKDLLFNPTEQIIALVNAQEIKSVIVNLVVNALDSMEEGGTLAINLGIRDGLAEIVFQDTGCGMTAEVLENIFEPFYTRSRTGKGTGLGLSICHRIITQHQGEIEAHSAGPDRGSTFTIRLPLQPADEEAGRDSKDRRDSYPGLAEHRLPLQGRQAA
jgi:two-component system NtrC family sensor kinase